MEQTILIAEDEEIILNLLQRRLTTEGYRVLVAKNGVECLEVLKKETPDMLLLDIIMPKKDGFEVLEAMRKDEVLRAVPVVIISNSGQPLELERAKKLGVKDWLVKIEFDPKEVIEKVKKALARTSPA